MLLDVQIAKLHIQNCEILIEMDMDRNHTLKVKLTNICSTLSMNLIAFFDTGNEFTAKRLVFL